jgi:hypothetical protein
MFAATTKHFAATTKHNERSPMDALDNGSLRPVRPAATRRAKRTDHHTVQSIVLAVLFVGGIVGVAGALIQGQNTAAFLIGLFVSAVILGALS